MNKQNKLQKPKTIDDLRELHRLADDILWRIQLKYKQKIVTLDTGIKLKDIFGRSEEAQDYFLDQLGDLDKEMLELKKQYEAVTSCILSTNSKSINYD